MKKSLNDSVKLKNTFYAKIKHRSARFFSGMTHGRYLVRDIIISTSVAFVLLAGIFFGDDLSLYMMEKRTASLSDDPSRLTEEISEEQIYEEVMSIQEAIDRSNWKKHKGQWYGFEVEYPEDWAEPVSQSALRGAKWEYRYQFRKNEIEESGPYIGFDLVIYNLAKTKTLFDTDEFSIKREEWKTDENCQNIEGHIIETGDYPAEEIYVPLDDECYQAALFFTYTKGQYIYSLVPMGKEGSVLEGDPRIEIMDNFPEFFEIASTLNPIDIVRPKAEAKPKITAPKPVSFKIVDGKMVCAKKNDKPGKSKQDKGKHLDMECCLDPDEYPNPWCYYDPKKYGKYL